MRKAVFFDLDGTLLPLDMHRFSRIYYKMIKRAGFFDRISKDKGEDIFKKAIYAMFANDGRALNRDVFFETIEKLSGVSGQALLPYMESFYRNEYKKVKRCTRTDKRAVETVMELKRKGLRLILATNPVFPEIATDQRIAWASLSPSDFEYISYYDNSSYFKPNPKYYQDILDKTGLLASECYIVGNDVTEDMSATALGFKGFLVLDHVIGDMERAPECEQGNYSDLLDFARSLAI